MACYSRLTFHLLLIALSASPLWSQGTGTLRGVIRDQANAPLAGAEILITSIDRATVTNERGEFRLDNLPAGSLLVLARMLGYTPHRISVTIREGETTGLTFVMERAFQVLEDIEVAEDRRGLYGIVADTLRRPLPEAMIRVHPARTQKLSDTAGRFAFPQLKPGPYALLVSHPEYEDRRVHVTIPRGGSRDIMIFLMPGSSRSRASTKLREAMYDLGLRLASYDSRRRMNQDELRLRGEMRLCDIPRIASMVKNSYPIVIVNGTEVIKFSSLCDWNAGDASLLEWGGGCSDISGGVRRLLGKNCGDPLNPQGLWVMFWTKQ